MPPKQSTAARQSRVVRNLTDDEAASVLQRSWRRHQVVLLSSQQKFNME